MHLFLHLGYLDPNLCDLNCNSFVDEYLEDLEKHSGLGRHLGCLGVPMASTQLEVWRAFVNGIWRNGLFALTIFYIVFICFLSTEASVEMLFI